MMSSNKFKIDDNNLKITTTTTISSLSSSSAVTKTSNFSRTTVSHTTTGPGTFPRLTQFRSSDRTPSTSYTRSITPNAPYRSAFNDQPAAVYRSLTVKKSDVIDIATTDKRPSKSSIFSFFKSDDAEKIDKEKKEKEKQKVKERQKEIEKQKEKEKKQREKEEKEKQKEKEKLKEEEKRKQKMKKVVPNATTTDARLVSSQPYSFNLNELDKKLKIKVTKTYVVHGLDDNKVPTYKTNSRFRRGKVLVINNIAFKENKKYRHGADVDHDNITKLFSQMGFSVTDHKNKSEAAMKRIIENHCADSSLKSADISVTIIMSHGNGMLNSTYIETIDNKCVEIEWIVKQYSNSIYLANKPKIFIFQCCRGDSQDTLQTDAIPFQVPRTQADVLLAYATVPGYVAHRDSKLGTWYIQGICKIFMEHAHDTDIESLLKIVDDNLAKNSTKHRQTSSYENRGFRRCYINPI